MKNSTSFLSLSDPLFQTTLLLKIVLSFALLWLVNPVLFPDEAQYWVWSRYLDIGYYSKPPGIAWIHALVGSFLPKSAMTIRLPSLFFSAFAAFHLYKCARALGASVSSARYSTWLFLFSPIVLYGSFAATTDVGLLLGWCASLHYLEVPLDSTKQRCRLVFWAFWGMLFKPTLILLALASWFRFEDPQRKAKAWLLFLGCFLGALPPVVWNIEHGAVTFLHVWTQLFVSKATSGASFWSGFHFLRPFEFFLIQVALFSPLVSLKIIQAVKRTFRRKRSEIPSSIRWHMWLALAILGFTVLSSFRIKFQANWPLVAFPSFFCVLSFYGNFYTKKWAKGHILTHLFVFVLALIVSLGQSRGWHWTEVVPKNINLFRSVEGWQSLSKNLPALSWKEGEGFWLSDKYQTCSLLSFYGPSEKVYWFNLHGARKNQFSLWPVESKWIQAPARFVTVESCTEEQMKSMTPLYLERLSPYFKNVKEVQILPLWKHKGIVQRVALVIDLEGYQGSRPKDPNQY